MTIDDFDKLNVGDYVCLPDKHKKPKYWSTEITKIDKGNKKLEVFLGKRPYSYKYIQLIGEKQISYGVGLVRDTSYILQFD